ncbi:reverse transcriptase domain-containing protein [Tanacetum coccineum]|uniref:Reverse transcriptase domain-containing protein n=1 Tax=Tanacetum coccineum TaxID=301880 RepID=A0ABQ5DM10_9ASTR
MGDSPNQSYKRKKSHSPAFIKENIDVLRTMIKEHDRQAKIKATPRRLAYANSDKEAPARSLARGFSDRFSLESSGTSDTHRQTRSASKNQRTPSKNKEPARLRRSRRLEDRSITKEKTRRKRSKSRGKNSEYQETSSDSEYEEGLKDMYEDLNSPYKRPKPTPFTQRITRFKYHRRANLPRNIRIYEGNKDPEDHLGGAARNWFDDLDPKSVDSFEELSQKFLEEFSQQKRYDKVPTEIHGIKRRQNEGLQAFMDRFNNHGKGMKEQNGANGVCYNKMLFAVQHHNRKDRNEKPQSVEKLCRNVDSWKGCKVFAWVGSKRTIVPQFVMEHQLKIYPLVELLPHQRRPLTLNGRQALKEKVFGWLKEGMIRKVQHPEWVTNTIPIKLANGTWKVQVDYSSLNKVCAKDMYPFSEEGEELASLMEYP